MGYLVLSRRLNDRISIGNDIEIVISDLKRNNKGEMIVDLAIKAPKGVIILRQETHLRDIKGHGITNRNKSR